MWIALGALLVSYIFPVGLLIFLINNHRGDKHYRKNCLTLFIQGIGLALPVLLGSLATRLVFALLHLNELNTLVNDVFSSFITEAMVEECMKYMCTRRMIRQEHDNVSLMDVMAYACIPGIGFEIMEAFVYIFSTNIPQILVRGITNMHSVFGLIVGLVVGNGYKKGRKAPVIPALATSILIHGTYNLCLSETLFDNWGFISLIIAIACLIFIVVFYIKMIRKRKDPEFTAPLFPTEKAAEAEAA